MTVFCLHVKCVITSEQPLVQTLDSTMRGTYAKGSLVRQLRKLRGLTQETLAERSSCDEKTIRKVEQCKRVDLSTLVKIAAILEVAPGDLMQ